MTWKQYIMRDDPFIFIYLVKHCFSKGAQETQWRKLLPSPETPGQAWVLLRALHNTRDLQLYVPSERRSNYG